MMQLKKLLLPCCAILALLLSLLAEHTPVSAGELREILPERHAALQKEAGNAWRAAEHAQELQTDLPLERGKEITPQNIGVKTPFFGNIGDIARILFWGSVIIVILIVIMNLRNNLWSQSRSRKVEYAHTDESAPEASMARMDAARMNAEELARRGSFTEAMHVLLLQSVSELRRRLDVSIAASLTSREILRTLALSEDAGRGFADIIRHVEISYFGSFEPGETEYLACRASYEALTRELQKWSGQ